MQSNAREIVSKEGELDVRYLLGILINGRWIILVATAAIMFLGVMYVTLAQPIYQADAVVQVEKKASPIASLTDLTSLAEADGEDSSAVTEIDIIKSRRVLGAAVDKLNLLNNVRPAGWSLLRRFSGYKKGDLVVNDFQVSPDLQGKEFEVLVVGAGQFNVFKDGQQVGAGHVGKPLSLSLDEGAATFTVTQLLAEPGRRFIISCTSRQQAVDTLVKSLQVEEQGKLSGVIKLSMKGADKDQIVDILSVVASAYVQQNIDRRAEEARKGLDFLGQQLPKVRADLYKSETALNAFRLKSGSLDVEQEAKAALEKTTALQVELGSLSIQEAELGQMYSYQHPAYKTILEQKAIIERQLADAKQQVAGLPQTQLEMLRLTRDVQVNETLYLQIFSKVQELEVLRAGTVGNVRILDNPEAELGPVSPKKAVTVVLATILGLILGVAVTMLRVAMNPGVRDAEELDQIGIPVLAVIPLSDAQANIERQQLRDLRMTRRGLAGGVRPQNYLLGIIKSEDIAMEALRSLRTSLHFSLLEARNNLVMICGPSPGVGKTFVSANLGVVLAHANQRVLLIDADMRRGTLHELFRLPPNQGLSEYLVGKLPRETVVKKSGVEGLDIIGRGSAPSSPAELLISSGMNNLLEWASTNYDLVIIDTPPILAVTEAAIVGRHVGTTLLVVRHRKNPVREVELTLKRFAQNGVAVQGCILNGLEGGWGGYGYKYGYYAYEYARGVGNKPDET